MPKPKPAPILTMTDVANLFGLKGQRRARKALRFLQGLERRTGAKLLTVIDSGRYFTSMALIREHCPDFFYKREEAVEILKESVEYLEEELALANERIEIVAEKTTERICKAETRIGRLETHISLGRKGPNSS